MYNYEALTDEELQYIAKDKIKLFLDFIKKNNRRYLQYSKRLGNMKENSILVQRNLPKIVTSLYRKQDGIFVEAMEKLMDDYASMLLDKTNETLGREVDVDEFVRFSNEEIVDLLTKYNNQNANCLDLDLFWIQLKLLGFKNLTENKSEISRQLGIEQSDIRLDDSVSVPTEKDTTVESSEPKNIIRKKKTKKLTPEEKKAKTKAAEAKKAELKETIENNKETMGEKNTEDRNDCDNGIVVSESENISITEDKEKVEKEQMAVYLGIIKINNGYYNFTPIGCYQEGSFESFRENDLDVLLPKSNYHNINFYYNNYNDEQARFMEKTFTDGQLFLLQCEIDQLEENRNRATGELQQTGYKINANSSWRREISLPSEIGLYRLLPKKDLIDDIRPKRAIRVNNQDLVDGEKVLVDFGEGFYGGPFQVGYSTQNDNYFITGPDLSDKYCIQGYRDIDLEKIYIAPSYDVSQWIGDYSYDYYTPKKGTKLAVKDIIPDECLLEVFREGMDNSGGHYDSFDINEAIREIDSSLLIGNGIPKDIRDRRMVRIREMLSDREMLDKFYKESSDLFCDFLFKNVDNESLAELLSKTLDEKPDMLGKFSNIRAIQAKIDSMRSELEQLESKKKEVEEQLQQNQKEETISKENYEKKLDAEFSEKKEKLDAVLGRLGIADDVERLKREKENIEDDVRYLEKHKGMLTNDTKTLQIEFARLINESSTKMAGITFDGYMSSKMLKAAAEWEGKNNAEKLEEKVRLVNENHPLERTEDELITYLCTTIQRVRPDYTKNTILNILTCVTQGFLTVFSGKPGCGKTSICNIVSNVLGLNKYENVSAELKGIRRFIPVSVERGWTSKRDFIGYYNPLTKAFEECNREVFDGLRLLDMEQRDHKNTWPFYILLDEANLSPMEYYWADFMNVCDDLSDNSSINLGNDNVFRIPETLHFLATINNDHTTETLSPRLIDRAWVITLPRVSSTITVQKNNDIPEDVIRNVTWGELKKVFAVPKDEEWIFDRETRTIYDGLKEILAKQDIFISPRVDIAIQKYWKVAARIMEEDEYSNSTTIIALDYAISQKILPKILGSGEEYETWLDELKSFCNKKGLLNSARTLSTIIERGNRQMKYYHFFN